MIGIIDREYRVLEDFFSHSRMREGTGDEATAIEDLAARGLITYVVRDLWPIDRVQVTVTPTKLGTAVYMVEHAIRSGALP